MYQMLKDEIDKVLLLSIDYFKSNFGHCMDIGELKELSDWIMGEMNEDLEIEKQSQRNYLVSHLQLRQLMVSGEYEFKDILGNTITLRYENETEIPSTFESGTILLWDKSRYNNTDSNIKSEKNKQAPYQSILKCITKKRKRYCERYTRIDFNKNIYNIDNLISICTKLNWKGNLKPLQKIRSDFIHELIGYSILEGKQKTIDDYPTDEDKARNSHLKPGAENEVVGIDEAVKEIMKIIGREIQNQNVMG